MSGLHDLTAAQAVAEIRGGRLSPVELVDALPMNATGKVTKFVLREQARAAADRSG